MRVFPIAALACLASPSWSQCLTAIDSGPTPDDTFGFSLQVSGNHAAVYGVDLPGSTGLAMYLRSDAGWVADGILDASWNFDLDHGRLAGRTTQDAVRIFSRGAGGWALESVITAPFAQPDADFGRSVALDGDLLAVASPEWDLPNIPNAGRVDLYRWTGQWDRIDTFLPGSVEQFPDFGAEVDLKDGVLTVLADDSVSVYRETSGSYVLEQFVLQNNPSDVQVGNANRLRIRGRIYDFVGGAWVNTWNPPFTHQAHDFDEDGDRLAASNFFDEITWVWEHDGSGLWSLAQEIDADAQGLGTQFLGEVVALDGSELWLRDPGSFLTFIAEVWRFNLLDLTRSYCGPAPSNSTGAPAVLEGMGCPTLAENDVVLRVSQLPVEEPTFLLFSRDRGLQPLFGGVGTLCLSPAWIPSAPILSNVLGQVTVPLDLEALPVFGAPGVPAGERLYIQAWYRDLVAGTANLSDAIELRVQ